MTVLMKMNEFGMRDILQRRILIRVGYGRVKGRMKSLRQNFKGAVIEGTRSGSGKLLINNWGCLVMIWGGYCYKDKRCSDIK